MLGLNDHSYHRRSRAFPERRPPTRDMLPYDTFKSRFESYKNYPKNHLPKPKDLAQAGFYYTLDSDKVICFECGVGLNDWEKNDDAYLEHKKFSPGCMFMRSGGVRNFLEIREGKEDIEINKTDDDNLCVICRERNRTVLSLPCRHLVTCETCNDELCLCTICGREERQRIIIDSFGSFGSSKKCNDEESDQKNEEENEEKNEELNEEENYGKYDERNEIKEAKVKD